MTQPNLPDEPAWGSVEGYLEMLRAKDAMGWDLYPYAFGIATATASNSTHSPEERIRRIANLDAAMDAIRAEQRARPEARGPVHTGPVTDEGLVDETERGERVEVGADGCGCPITEEVRPNSTSIDGTERVEHRLRCWNAVPVDLAASGLTSAADASGAPKRSGERAKAAILADLRGPLPGEPGTAGVSCSPECDAQDDDRPHRLDCPFRLATEARR